MAGAVTRPAAEAVAAAILHLTAARGAGKSVCPSEVARALASQASLPEAWRTLMGAVRDAAVGLARGGAIEILRKGRPVDPDSLRGVIRLRIATR